MPMALQVPFEIVWKLSACCQKYTSLSGRTGRSAWLGHVATQATAQVTARKATANMIIRAHENWTLRSRMPTRTMLPRTTPSELILGGDAGGELIVDACGESGSCEIAK